MPKVVINRKTPKIACPGDLLLIYRVESISKFDWVIFDRVEDCLSEKYTSHPSILILRFKTANSTHTLANPDRIFMGHWSSQNLLSFRML
ncbi:hypothetical protein E0H89_15640 [Acinetobacter sp. ANC 3781]|uniref:hypothetical protein n=1 Tax=Acinetobacter sp. ANC 3781 TaxID=2529835 RepID=UPI0010396D96|nr:hypothetical protein [Acinetobacter sp. ANC 3781]TCB71208.1 hypothetical protein E0H89_15640 [Acinetobacter sp. ANC 3781]